MTVFKGMVIFALGFSLGAVAANVALKDSFEERVQERLDSMNDVDTGSKARMKTDYGASEGSITGQVSKLRLMRKEYTGIARQYDPRLERIREEDDEPSQEDYDSHNENLDINPYPYVISDQAFSFECGGHEKEILYYYGQDRVLCDDAHDRVGNGMELVGNVDSYFGRDASESRAVYVRNERMETDYEIIFLGKKFSVVVSGEET